MDFGFIIGIYKSLNFPCLENEVLLNENCLFYFNYY